MEGATMLCGMFSWMILDIGVVSGSDQVAAQRAHIEISKSRAAHQFLVSILGPDFVEQARRELRTEGLDIVAVGQIALLA